MSSSANPTVRTEKEGASRRSGLHIPWRRSQRESIAPEPAGSSAVSSLAKATYQYKPLSIGSVRIFTLAAFRYVEYPFEGSISHVPLANLVRDESYYVALSYVWGTGRDTEAISVDGCVLAIGTNLGSALRHLRRRNRPTRLWIDAICINQLYLDERNHQVQQMRSIYESAYETIVYLGGQTNSNTEDSAWNFLERNSPWAYNGDQERDYGLPARREEEISFRGNLHDICYELLNRDWFTRVWVLQEVVVFRDVSIQKNSCRCTHLECVPLHRTLRGPKSKRAATGASHATPYSGLSYWPRGHTTSMARAYARTTTSSRSVECGRLASHFTSLGIWRDTSPIGPGKS